MRTGYTLHAERSPWRPVPEFFLILHEGESRTLIQVDQKNIKLQPLDIRQLPSTFSLPSDSVQEVFDSLYAMGFRPTRPVNDDGAMKLHLEDMRKIAFQFLDTPLDPPKV